MRLKPSFIAALTAVALMLLPAVSGATGKKEISLRSIAHFSSPAEAQKSCGSDPVVWANLRTSVYHLPGSRWFGKTKKGAYFCESAVEKAGVRASKE